MPDCESNPLCEIAQTKFEEMDRRWQGEINSLEKEIAKSETILGVRLEEMNNFRKQIQDERQNLATRREAVLLNFIISIVVVIIGTFVAHVITK